MNFDEVFLNDSLYHFLTNAKISTNGNTIWLNCGGIEKKKLDEQFTERDINFFKINLQGFRLNFCIQTCVRSVHMILVISSFKSPIPRMLLSSYVL